MTQEEFHKRYQYNPNTDCLGEGGFGKVYKAFDTHRDRYVAIKMAEVKPHLEEVRLRKEVETISKLPSHPNIAYYEECYTFSTFAGEYDFGVLQYYELGNLEQLLREKQLNNTQKENILRQILQGIEFLHSQGIIHRDLKPQNILVVNRNAEYIPKITDFGISKTLDANKSSVFTNSLAGAGTLAFASPEQLLGTTIRKNTDLWSFGVLVCWMFTGKLPFNTGNQTVTSEAGRLELFKQITVGDISSIISQLPSEWGNLVKRCIVVDVEKRISGAVKCLEMLNINTEVPIETHKSEKTSINKTINTTETTEAPVNSTNYKSTHIETPEPKPTLIQVENDAPKSHLIRNISIGVGILAIVALSLIYFFYYTDENPEQTAAIESVSSTNTDTTKLQVSSNEPVVTSNSDKNTQNQNISNTETVATPIAANYSTVTDIDGNVYKTVKIGNQVWMAENLKVTHYRNGDAIPNMINNVEWGKMTEGAYCNYNNNSTIGAEYGKLYNWYTVSDARGLAPEGWHVPSDAEWKNLTSYLGGESVAGRELKEAGTVHWESPFNGKDTIKGGINSVGFSAHPGGYRDPDAKYYAGIGNVGNWWTSKQGDQKNAWSRRIYSDYNDLSRNNYNKRGGFSVRCIKDK